MFGFLFKSPDQKISGLLRKANCFYEEEKYDAAAGLYRRILKIDPGHFAAKANLATACFELEDFTAAALLFEELVRRDGGNPWWHNYLSQAYQKNGAFGQALDEAWQAVVQSGGENEHHLNLAYAIYETAEEKGAEFVDSVLKKWYAAYPENGIVRQCYRSFYFNEDFACSEPEYVESLFDVFAPDFDRVLADLEYRSPQDIAEILAAYFAERSSEKKRILDLGCGSGLCGKYLRRIFKNSYLFGVDISTNMLAEARRKKVYSGLLKCNISECPSKLENHFDIVVAADVFTYFGRLDSLFVSVSKMLRHKGVFAFTVSQNTVNGKDYFLMPSSRFVHADGYVRKILSSCGFSVWSDEKKILRLEGEKKVAGKLFLAVKK